MTLEEAEAELERVHEKLLKLQGSRADDVAALLWTVERAVVARIQHDHALLSKEALIERVQDVIRRHLP